ncbi:AP2 domain transcription factor AP2IX-1 [Toxoplasma gondii ME49]|uniref:AP2 domain transcription factor AP2IX-1 n=3 Tax=Toxoplasma gondii TaxID=5811 RepID=S8EYX0_TOXGM|nr:AP2 domain transcription factor AP2IX-1 [Toxoplasma gondii ME49]EPT27577.1 AP2 domain transcription factor AP2IX-1 [Toxoplasma gondii ME49]KFH01720.1 AP2 domain transcription factor AP2IX-1 [Toxoplasma gondii VAND]KYF45608.1 AP2 domain transcription factor AP2IX-1 [Toxoplasma gondii ARI]|eukprot:XP_018636234.1 AP2 domain transcription factor AP2IX-1 [Toxoplasma gondii ME49]
MIHKRMGKVVFSQDEREKLGPAEEMEESATIRNHDDGLPKSGLDLMISSDEKRKATGSNPRAPEATENLSGGLQEATCPASSSRRNSASGIRSFTSTLLALSLAAPQNGQCLKDQGLDCIPGVKLSKAECPDRLSSSPNPRSVPNVLAENCGYPRKITSDTSTSSGFTGNGEVSCLGSNAVSRLQTGDGAWCPLNSLLETAAWAASSESGDKKCSERLADKLTTSSTTTPRGAPDYCTSNSESKPGHATPDTTTGCSTDNLPSSPDRQDSLGRMSKDDPPQRLTGEHTLRRGSPSTDGLAPFVSGKDGRRLFLDDDVSQLLDTNGGHGFQALWSLLTEAKDMLRGIAAVQQSVVEAQQQLTLLHKSSLLGTGLPWRVPPFRRTPSTTSAVDDRGNRDVRSQLEALGNPDQMVDWDEPEAFATGALASAVSGDVNAPSTQDLSRILREGSTNAKSPSSSQTGSDGDSLQHMVRSRRVRPAVRPPSPLGLEAVLSGGEIGQRHLGLDHPATAVLRSSTYAGADSFSTGNVNGVGTVGSAEGCAASYGQQLLAPIFPRGHALDKHECVEAESQLPGALKKRARPRGPNWSVPEGADKARSALRLTLPSGPLYQGSASPDEPCSRKSLAVELGGGHMGEFQNRTKRKASLITEHGLPDSPSQGDDGEDGHGIKQPSPQSATDVAKNNETLQCVARMTTQKKIRPAWPREDAPMPGVRFAKDRNSWVAFWCENGKQNYKSFSNKKFGCERARLMAIAARHAFDQRVARQQLQQYQQQLNEQHQLKQLHSKKQSRSLLVSRPATENTPGDSRAVAGVCDLPVESVFSCSLSAAGLSDGSARQEANVVAPKRVKDSKADRPAAVNRNSFDDDSAEMLGKAALGLSFAELQKLAESLEIPQHLYSPHHNLLQTTTELPSAAASGLTVPIDSLKDDFSESRSAQKKQACLQLEKIPDVNNSKNRHLGNSADPQMGQEDVMQGSEQADRHTGRNMRRGSSDAVEGENVSEGIRDSAVLV